MRQHIKVVENIQKQIKESFLIKDLGNNLPKIALKFESGNSNTTRSKNYKARCRPIECGPLNRIIHIDIEKHIVIVEPRVTMEALLNALLPYGLTLAVIPEFKGITVGGAIMGAAAESSSHKWGIFNDICSAFEMICGDGNLIRVSATENSDIFYGVTGSYGSLGMLVLAEIKLIPVTRSVHLRYHFFRKATDLINACSEMIHSQNAPEFLDGLIFSREQGVLIEGNFFSKSKKNKIPSITLKPSYAPWYYQHVRTLNRKSASKIYEEVMDYTEYIFRYDQGAFWMGAYLFKIPLLLKFITQGMLTITKSKLNWFDEHEIKKFHIPADPNFFLRLLTRSQMTSQKLWGLLHRAEKWVQNRFIIQDCCIPESRATAFAEKVVSEPGLFPLWICPIKGTKQAQIFAPHYLNQKQEDSHFINVGLYGLPSHSMPIANMTRELEKLTLSLGGRKVLYSRSYYTEEDFWRIYPHSLYEILRKKMHAHGIWHHITEKVLSE